jgi:hypothetical protein
VKCAPAQQKIAPKRVPYQDKPRERGGLRPVRALRCTEILQNPRGKISSLG